MVQLSAPRKWTTSWWKVKDSSGAEYAAKLQVTEDYNTLRGEYIKQFNTASTTMELAAMTPQERVHLQWARGFIQSTNAMEDFWKTQKYHSSVVVEEIMDIIEKPRSGSPRSWFTRAAKKFKFIIRPLEEAVYEHEKAVTSILTVDLSVPTVDIPPQFLSQRQDLLHWKWVFAESIVSSFG